ncbi:MAG: Rpn family recombination-promoting nuclease/putative transposase [Minicystis sp.]
MGAHDALFKFAFSNVEHARGVLETALPQAIAARIDFSSLALLGTSFVDEALSDHHSDLLYSGRIGGRDGFLYLLWEHKSAPEPLTALQVLRYMVRIWDKHVAEVLAERQSAKDEGRVPARGSIKLPVIVVVVLHHGPGGWTAATRFEDLLDADEDLLAALGEHVPRFALVVDDVAAQSDDTLHARAASAYARLVLWALKNAQDAGWIGGDHVRWVKLIRDVLAGPEGLRALAALFKYILTVNPEAKPDEVRKLLPGTVEEVVMNWYQEQFELSRKAGEREGERKGQQALVLKLLRLRFGELPAEVVARVGEADTALLDHWAERVLTATRLDEVLGAA